jgi:hypothetical protein
MRRITAVLIVALAAGSAFGEKPLQNPHTPAVVPEPVMRLQAPLAATPGTTPVLMSDVRVQTGDSEMLQAAKKAVASRQKTRRFVIDMNALIAAQGVVLSTSEGGASVSHYAYTAPEQRHEDRSAAMKERAELEQRRAALQQEMAEMAFHEEQGENADGTEDMAVRRSSEIPNQIQEINRQLNTPTP